ncbi:MAG: hypothetical protein U0167_11175 [bacterium]
MNLKTILAGLALASLIAAPAGAQQAIIRVSGHAWETGGYPPSVVGDQLQAVGIVNEIVAPLYWQPAIHSYTFYTRSLSSLGEAIFGTTHVVTYGGGLLTLYRDSLPSNADYGVNPPNATSPATFTDGDAIYLDGYFTDFTLVYNTLTLSGSFSGTLNFTGGIVFPHLTDPNGWTFGSNLSGQSPVGYDLQLNGDIYTDGPIAIEPQSWGGLKSLYR